jgi:hypothetical protein
MRKALVIATTLALLLIAGAAVAFMANPGGYFGGSEVELAEEEGDFGAKEYSSPEVEEELKPSDEIDHSEDEKDHQDEVDEPKDTETDHPEDEVDESKDEEIDDSEDEVDESKDEETEHEEEASVLELVILYPENGQRFDEKTIAFEGKVTPGAQVFAGDYEADVDVEGNWRIVLILNEGGNLATLTAVTAEGNESTAQVKVYYDPPKEESEKESEKDYEFTANQKYGSCAEEIPYDIWYGTGEPGTKIWIESEYGSATTTIGEKGKWKVKVEFPESPCGETFQVVLETDTGIRKVYDFVRICESKEDDGK